MRYRSLFRRRATRNTLKSPAEGTITICIRNQLLTHSKRMKESMKKGRIAFCRRRRNCLSRDRRVCLSRWQCLIMQARLEQKSLKILWASSKSWNSNNFKKILNITISKIRIKVKSSHKWCSKKLKCPKKGEVMARGMIFLLGMITTRILNHRL